MSEELRLRWTSQVHYLPGNRFRCPPREVPTRTSEAQLRSLMQTEKWTPEERAATLVHLAAHSLKDGEQEFGRALIVEALQTGSAEWGNRYVEAVAYLLACLVHDMATRAEGAKAWEAAAEHFAVAAAQYVLCEQDDLALSCLHIGLKCVQKYEGVAASRAASALIQGSIALRASTDETIGWQLHGLYQRLGYTMCGSTADLNAMILLHQAAKGMDFTLAIESPGPLIPSSRLHQQLDKAETRASLPPDPEFPFGVESAMLYYVGSGEAEPESDPDAWQRNLQRVTDRWISRELHMTRNLVRNRLVGLDEVQAVLPEDTVLISLFLVEMRDGTTGTPQASTQGLAVTREGFDYRTMVVKDIHGGLMQFTRAGHTLFAHPSAGPIAALRQAIVADPLHRLVSRDAQLQLSEASHHYLAGLAACLPRWRAQGKRHLCIWPNGPLHYVPFNLLPVAGKPVADDWAVTQIPSLSFLRPTIHTSSPEKRGLVTFASADGGARHGLDSQESLEQHASMVANAMGGTAVLGNAATPRRFLADLANARYVHVAAHGAHNEWASWYQCLFLSPAADTDGRVFAHDILRTDLRGVELVTMSSCESALGRFDPNDNLRGLPAALLAAGASAVIGCLWPVHPQVATVFFTALYEQLSTNPDRRSAFRAAQTHTRNLHPAYRDWGAFCFIGDWRATDSTQGAL
ncbi:CHAT domain-containing protein [Nonomuraea wenchangensis]|uniref:CHAT domain-containing protein n=1 Tax=Nonomuraea wenchangensis TaxID=568860 RepID=UPI00331EF6D4